MGAPKRGTKKKVQSAARAPGQARSWPRIPTATGLPEPRAVVLDATLCIILQRAWLLCSRLHWPKDQYQEIGIEPQSYAFADAFCGAGDMSVGVRDAGLGITCAFDVDADAVDTYTWNHCQRVCGRISAQELLARGPGNRYETAKVDIRHLSPPCQGFTSAARGRPRNGEDNNNCMTYVPDTVEKVKPRNRDFRGSARSALQTSVTLHDNGARLDLRRLQREMEGTRMRGLWRAADAKAPVHNSVRVSHIRVPPSRGQRTRTDMAASAEERHPPTPPNPHMRTTLIATNWAYSVGAPFKTPSTASETTPQIIFSCIPERNVASRIGQRPTRQTARAMARSQAGGTVVR